MQRYIPFGYKVENGETTVNEQEAATVRTIFKLYIGGSSYKTIAEHMESQCVNYHQHSSKWNKNMVKRILENNKYSGKNGYPALMEQADFNNAAKVIAVKGGKQNVQTPLCSVKDKAICHECGSEFIRQNKGGNKIKWLCKNSDCKTEIKITDELIENAIMQLMNIHITNPLLIRQTDAAQTTASLEITRLSNELNREFYKKESDKEYIKAMILALAEEKYKHCDDGAAKRQTKSLRDIFTCHKPITKFDGGLFQKTVRHLYIAKDGTMKLELINRQII